MCNRLCLCSTQSGFFGGTSVRISIVSDWILCFVAKFWRICKILVSIKNKLRTILAYRRIIYLQSVCLYMKHTANQNPSRHSSAVTQVSSRDTSRSIWTHREQMMPDALSPRWCFRAAIESRYRRLPYSVAHECCAKWCHLSDVIVPNPFVCALPILFPTEMMTECKTYIFYILIFSPPRQLKPTFYRRLFNIFFQWNSTDIWTERLKQNAMKFDDSFLRRLLFLFGWLGWLTLSWIKSVTNLLEHAQLKHIS